MQEAILVGDVISQLQAVGGLPEWEVYVALHAPTPADLGFEGVRTKLVSELLLRNAPTWAAEASKREFLYSLGVPESLLATSLAVHARSRMDQKGKAQIPIHCRLEIPLTSRRVSDVMYTSKERDNILRHKQRP